MNQQSFSQAIPASSGNGSMTPVEVVRQPRRYKRMRPGCDLSRSPPGEIDANMEPLVRIDFAQAVSAEPRMSRLFSIEK